MYYVKIHVKWQTKIVQQTSILLHSAPSVDQSAIIWPNHTNRMDSSKHSFIANTLPKKRASSLHRHCKQTAISQLLESCQAFAPRYRISVIFHEQWPSRTKPDIWNFGEKIPRTVSSVWVRSVSVCVTIFRLLLKYCRWLKLIQKYRKKRSIRVGVAHDELHRRWPRSVSRNKQYV